MFILEMLGWNLAQELSGDDVFYIGQNVRPLRF